MVTRAEEKIYRSLSQKKFRNQHQLFLVEGQKAVSELLSSSIEIRKILTSSQNIAPPQTESCTVAQLSAITSMKTAPSIIAVAEMPKPVALEKVNSHVFLLDSIRDPGNLGTMLRTARWFGAEQIILSPDCADPFNPKVVQASMGALFHLAIHQINLMEAIKILKQDNFEILAADLNGNEMNTTTAPPKRAVIIGNEGHGISPAVLDKCDQTLTISGGGYSGVESLNAAISLGIIAHQLYDVEHGK